MDNRARGIDVSHYDPTVDWSAAASAGISFAFAKASQGSNASSPSYTDPMFANHWQAIKDAGILRGAYHFIGLPQPTTPQANWNDDIHSQIDHFLSQVGPLQPGDLPPVLDLEDGDSPARWAALIASDREAALGLVRESITYLTAQIQAQAPGVLPILYTGSFWWSQLRDPDAAADNMPFGSYPLWFAQYPLAHATPRPVPGQPGKTDGGEVNSFDEYTAFLDGHVPRHIPKVWGGAAAPVWSFWQFTEFGQLPAVGSQVFDLTVFNGTVDDLKALCIPAPSQQAGDGQ